MFSFMNGNPGYCILEFKRRYVELINFVLVETARFPRKELALGMDLKVA